jgi:hypothetical protein
VEARLKRGRRDAIVPHCRRCKKRGRRDDLRFRASANAHATKLGGDGRNQAPLVADDRDSHGCNTDLADANLFASIALSIVRNCQHVNGDSIFDR